MTYQIELKNCVFHGFHGVLGHEKKNGQRFEIDAVLTVRIDTPLQEDDISRTVNYADVFDLIKQIVTGEPRDLIEALGDDIAQACLDEFKLIENVTITVRKPNAPIDGEFDYVSVRVQAER